MSSLLPTSLIVAISGGGIFLYNNRQTISVKNNEELIDHKEKEGAKEIAEKMDRIINNISEYISDNFKDDLLNDKSQSAIDLDAKNQPLDDKKLSNIVEIKSHLNELKITKNKLTEQSDKFRKSFRELIETIKGFGDLSYIRIKNYGEHYYDILSRNIKLDELPDLEVPEKLVNPVHEWPIYKTGLGFIYPVKKSNDFRYVSVMNYNKNNHKTIPLHKKIKKELVEITQTQKEMDKIVEKIYQVKKRLNKSKSSSNSHKVE